MSILQTLEAEGSLELAGPSSSSIDKLWVQRESASKSNVEKLRKIPGMTSGFHIYKHTSLHSQKHSPTQMCTCDTYTKEEKKRVQSGRHSSLPVIKSRNRDGQDSRTTMSH